MNIIEKNEKFGSTLLEPQQRASQSNFIQLAYVSCSRQPLGFELLSNILEVSQKNNIRDGITGILMYHDGLFFQILEGEAAKVERCYARILIDPHHCGECKVIEETGNERSFLGKPMVYVGPDDISGISKGLIKSLVTSTIEESYRDSKYSTASVLARIIYSDFGGL
ncbi:MAG: BLUF domain-containing protein [Sulfitobacter sp.]